MATNKKVLRIIKRKQIKDGLEHLENDPKYKNIIEKHRANYAGSLSFVAGTEQADASSEDMDIFTQAEILMEQIINGTLQLGNLDLSSKCNLLYYLERYNKRVGRIVDIQTRIPLSTIRIQKPTTQYQLINDYIYNWFDKLFNKFEFQAMIEKIVRHYWLFGFAAVMIDDDYFYRKGTAIFDDIDVNRSLSRFAELDKKLELTPEQLSNLDLKYRKSPSLVSIKERRMMIDAVLNQHSPNYKGPTKFTIMSCNQTLERQENKDINYYIYKIPVSENIKNTIEGIKNSLDFTEDDFTNLIFEAQKLGYTESEVRAYLATQDTEHEFFGQDNVLVDTDPFSTNGRYILTFERQGLADKDNSQFNRIIQDAIDLTITQRRMREKLNRGYKKDILVTTGEREDVANIEELQAMLNESAVSEEGSFIVTNMEVNVNDLDLNVNANLDLNELLEQANRNISEGVGIPESLISESLDAYSNSFLKTTILENEFVNFRANFSNFIEKKLFEPIAIKMGFIMTNEWGEVEAIYPKLKFNRMTLARGSDDLALITELVDSGKMPTTYIYEALGISKDEAMDEVRKELTTMVNPQIRETLSSSVGEQLAEVLPTLKSIKQELEENLDLPRGSLDKLDEATTDDDI